MNKSRFEAFSDGVYAFAITLLVLGFALPVVRTNALAYALSFTVIGIMWQNHQALFRLVERIDRTTVFWNLMLLGGTAFIPFATSTLGSTPRCRRPHSYTAPAYRIGWFAYFFAMLLALVLPLASFAAYIAVAVYYLIPRGVDDDITDVGSSTD